MLSKVYHKYTFCSVVIYTLATRKTYGTKYKIDITYKAINKQARA